jgi:hypothetical protein
MAHHGVWGPDDGTLDPARSIAENAWRRGRIGQAAVNRVPVPFPGGSPALKSISRTHFDAA